MGMAITWYGNQSTAESCNFGVLAVVGPLLERMQVASIINRHLPADPQAEYDHGSILTLLMAARLYSPVALVNVPGVSFVRFDQTDVVRHPVVGRIIDAYKRHRGRRDC